MSRRDYAQGMVSDAIAESRWDNARELLQTALARTPASWRALQEDEHRVQGAFWDQEEFFAYLAHHQSECEKTVMWCGPSYSKMWWQLAVVNVGQGRPEEAMVCIERGRALEPDQPRLWIEKGYLLNRSGQHEAALEGYKTAVAVRAWTLEPLVARAFRGQGSALIDLGRIEEATSAYLRSLELDPKSKVAKQELEYIERALQERREEKSLPWFLRCVKYPPSDPLTKQLLALVDGLESVPGPKTIGSKNYAKVSEAFLSRGWAGFEEALDAIVPRTRPDYVDVRRKLLREPIFSPKVHLRMARVFLGKTTINEVIEEIARDETRPRPQ